MNEKLAKMIRNERAIRGLTTRAMAKEMGVCHQSISAAERSGEISKPMAMKLLQYIPTDHPRRKYFIAEVIRSTGYFPVTFSEDSKIDAISTIASALESMSDSEASSFSMHVRLAADRISPGCMKHIRG